MTYVLLVLLFASFWCFGIWTLFQEGHILEKAGIFMDEYLPVYINKPFWKCPICQASIHGTAIYAIFLMPLHGIAFWIPFCICLCGFNHFVMQFFHD